MYLEGIFRLKLNTLCHCCSDTAVTAGHAGSIKAVLKSNILTLNKFKHEKLCQLFCKDRVGLQPLVVSMSEYVYPH